MAVDRNRSVSPISESQASPAHGEDGKKESVRDETVTSSAYDVELPAGITAGCSIVASDGLTVTPPRSEGGKIVVSVVASKAGVYNLRVSEGASIYTSTVKMEEDGFSFSGFSQQNGRRSLLETETDEVNEADRNSSTDAVVDALVTPSTDAVPESNHSALSSAATAVAAGIAIGSATVLIIMIATGLLQKLARKQAAKAGVGGFWSKVACIPSLVCPYNPFIHYPIYSSIDNFMNEKVEMGEFTGWDLYKDVSRTAHVRIEDYFNYDTESGESSYMVSIPKMAQAVDKWGGFLDFDLNLGDNALTLRGFLSDSKCGIFESRNENIIYVVRGATFTEVSMVNGEV